MKRLLAVGVAAASAATIAVWTAVAGGSTGSTGTVHVVEHAVTDAVSNGAKADKAGNVLTFANPVYDAADEKKVGTDNGFCVRTVKGKTWECMWTTFLSAGQITVEGPFSDAGNTKLAITGGTGAYANARGWMELDFHDQKGTKFDFVFHLS
ncbi:MAG TPA: dirigent protein [Gaiellaceae bacterium]|nr:dirigent protein [Gaiellaceae bacterium]